MGWENIAEPEVRARRRSKRHFIGVRSRRHFIGVRSKRYFLRD